MTYKIMPIRCEGCIAPLGFSPSPDSADFKLMVEKGRISPLAAVWSCKATCTHENLTKHPERIKGCLGSAIFFGAANEPTDGKTS